MSTYQVTRRLVATCTALVLAGALLGGCTKTPDKLVVDLGDSQTLVREKARTSLKDLGPEAVPYLLDGLVQGGDVTTGSADVLIEIGDASLEATMARLEQLCENDEAMGAAMRVFKALGSPTDMLAAYNDATTEGRCTEKMLLNEVLALEPDKTDVTVNIKENLRYKPVRFAYKAGPALPQSRALARLCLYDEELGWAVSEKNRDLDQQIYFDQWRMKDPLVRANLATYMTEWIWTGYYDNDIPGILKEETKEDAAHAATAIGVAATEWRTRLVPAKAVTRVTEAHTAVKAHYASNSGLFDEECLCLYALEEITEPIRQTLDEKNRKKDIQALDEAKAAITADREAACTAAAGPAFMPAPAGKR